MGISAWRVTLALAGALSLSVADPICATGTISVIYVAPNGSDSADGLSPTPGIAHGPLLTLTGARDKLRYYRTPPSQLDPNTTTHVKILPGDYYMNSPLVLEFGDSGTIAAPVSFEAYSATMPVITGGWNVRKQWALAPNPPPPPDFQFTVVNGVWQLQRDDLKATDPNSWQIEQLYVNGRRATRARTPNRNAFTETAPKGWLQYKPMTAPYPTDCGTVPLPQNWAHEDVSQSCFKLDPADYALLVPLTTDQLHDVQLTNLDYWTIDKAWVDRREPNNIVVLAGGLGSNPGMFPWGPLPASGNSRIELSGIPSALDAPGEFYVDRQLGLLRYYPYPGENPTTASVIAPRIQTSEIIQIQGTGTSFVENLSFHNLVIQYTPYLMRRTWLDSAKFTGGYVDSYGGFSLPAAITASGGRTLEFDGLEIRHTGATAIWLRGGTEQSTIKKCYLHDLGGGGIKVMEFDHGGETGDHTNLWAMVGMGGQHLITNNVIHDGGRVYYDANGIFLVKSPNNTVSFNEVGGFFNSGITTYEHHCGVSGVPDYQAGHDNLIRKNRVHQIGQDLLSDLAGIYTQGEEPGQLEEYNQIFNVRHFGMGSTFGGGLGYASDGIRLDGHECHTDLQYNLVYDVETNGIAMNMVDHNVTNNISALTEEAGLGVGAVGSSNVNINIVYRRPGYSGWVGPCNATPSGTLVNRNLYYAGAGGEASIYFQALACDPETVTWDAWQDDYGQDANSIAGADPLFVNPTNWDFTLQSGSPAVNDLFFIPFSVSDTGVDATSPYYSRRDELERPNVDFGGMYGFNDSGTYANPLYGTIGACPPGYTDTRAYGTRQVDWYLGFCYRTLSDQGSLAKFGGMFVGAGGFNQMANVTGCPSGFTPKQVFGAASTHDPDVYYCYSTGMILSGNWQFGGMYGYTGDAEVAGGVYLNPLAGRRADCPAGFGKYHIITATPAPNQNYDLWYCGKP